MKQGVVPAKLVEKPWGRYRLPPPFDLDPERKVGEIWFIPPPEMGRLLAKYLFTSEKVSVQVHATDEQTLARGIGKQGKDECWLILDADPGAGLGIGFNSAMDAEELRGAVLSGRIEEMLVWFSVEPGDFFYIPANVVHAIGPGVTLLEIEQNSDLTYRLYDYGRSRELHLEDGLVIARAEPYPDHLHWRLPGEGEVQLVDGPHFRLDRLHGSPSADVCGRYSDQPLLVLPLSGEARIGPARIGKGQCGAAVALDEIGFTDQGLFLIAQAVGADHQLWRKRNRSAQERIV